jgi:hypothetical protein
MKSPGLRTTIEEQELEDATLAGETIGMQAHSRLIVKLP